MTRAEVSGRFTRSKHIHDSVERRPRGGSDPSRGHDGGPATPRPQASPVGVREAERALSRRGRRREDRGVCVLAQDVAAIPPTPARAFLRERTSHAGGSPHPIARTHTHPYHCCSPGLDNLGVAQTLAGLRSRRQHSGSTSNAHSSRAPALRCSSHRPLHLRVYVAPHSPAARYLAVPPFTPSLGGAI